MPNSIEVIIAAVPLLISLFFLLSPSLPIPKIRWFRGTKAALYAFYILLSLGIGAVFLMLGSVPASDPGHARASAQMMGVIILAGLCPLAPVIALIAFAIVTALPIRTISPSEDDIRATRKFSRVTFGSLLLLSLILTGLYVQKGLEIQHYNSPQTASHRMDFQKYLATHTTITQYQESPIYKPGFDHPLGLHITFDLHYEGFHLADYTQQGQQVITPPFIDIDGTVNSPSSFDNGQQNIIFKLLRLGEYYPFNDLGVTHLSYDLWMDQSIREYTSSTQICLNIMPAFQHLISFNVVCTNAKCPTNTAQPDWKINIKWPQFTKQIDLAPVLIKALENAHSKILDISFWQNTQYNLTPQLLKETGLYSGCTRDDDDCFCNKR